MVLVFTSTPVSVVPNLAFAPADRLVLPLPHEEPRGLEAVVAVASLPENGTGISGRSSLLPESGIGNSGKSVFPGPVRPHHPLVDLRHGLQDHLRPR